MASTSPSKTSPSAGARELDAPGRWTKRSSPTFRYLPGPEVEEEGGWSPTTSSSAEALPASPAGPPLAPSAEASLVALAAPPRCPRQHPWRPPQQCSQQRYPRPPYLLKEGLGSNGSNEAKKRIRENRDEGQATHQCQAVKQKSPLRQHLAPWQSHQRPSSPLPPWVWSPCLMPLPGTPPTAV